MGYTYPALQLKNWVCPCQSVPLYQFTADSFSQPLPVQFVQLRRETCWVYILGKYFITFPLSKVSIPRPYAEALIAQDYVQF